MGLKTFKNSKEHAAVAWKWYKTANNSDNVILLGRNQALDAFNGKGVRLSDPNNWSYEVNGMFLKGGIDRGAIFKLVSDPSVKANLITTVGGKEIPSIYAWELKQLDAAGYVHVKVDGIDYMVPKDKAKTFNPY